ncbi:hypothetical protein Tco_1548694 [Tanacetum coccineum]
MCQLEGDVGRLHDDLIRLETSLKCCLGSCGAAGNMEMEPDIENMTMSEYLEYEATKERRLWDDVRSRRSPTNYNKADVDCFHRNKTENLSDWGAVIVQDSIWERIDGGGIQRMIQEVDGDDVDTL